jgi:choline-glycine betaine transporter
MIADFLPDTCLGIFMRPAFVCFFQNDKFEKTIHMTKSVAAIIAWVENQPNALLVMIVYWCSIAIAFVCETASITILATISTNDLQDESESWMAVWFFAVDGGIAWIVARECLVSVRRDLTRTTS